MSTPPTVEQIMSYPPLAAALKFVEELHKESPRGRVLIAAGFIEQQLRDVLAAFLSSETDLATLLDGANAPLGTFSARIAMCHALGLINGTEHHDLSLIRRIRNEFAQ